MSAATGTELRTREGLREERTAWGIPMVLGILLVVGGLFALALNVLTSFVSVLFLGALLLVVGVLEIISAFQRRRSSPFGSYVLVGLLTLVVGAMFLWRPLASLASLTLLFAGFVFASGLFHAITAVADRYPRWGWDLFYGLVAIALGVYIVAAWPVSSLWVLGTLVALEIIVRGVALVAASWMLRDIEHGRMPRPSLAPA